MSRPRHRLAATVLAIATAALGLTGPPMTATADAATRGPASATPAAPATAPTVDSTRALHLTSITPPVATPGADVHVSGTVTAPAGHDIVDPTVTVTLGASLGENRGSASAWTARRDMARGQVLAVIDLTGTATAAHPLPFTVTVPAHGIRSSLPFAARPIALTVTGDDGTSYDVLRTFVGWQARKEYEPLAMSFMLPVTLPPDPALWMGTDAEQLAAWQQAIGPGSPVDALLSLPATSNVNLVVDPAIGGPPTVDKDSAPPPPATTPPPPPGSPGPAPNPTSSTPGAPAPTASPQALAQLQSATRARLSARPAGSTWTLPYGDPDLAGALEAARGGRPDPAVSALAARSGTPGATTVWWQGDSRLPGDVSAARLFFGSAGPSVVLSDTSLVNPGPASDRDRTPGPMAEYHGLPVVAADTTLSAIAARIAAGEGAVARQEFLAESYTLLQELPGTPRSVVVALPRGALSESRHLADLLGAASATPWITAGPDARTLRTSPDRMSVTEVATDGSVPTRRVTPTLLATLSTQRQRMTKVGGILAGGDQFTSRLAEILDQLTSLRWAGAPAAADELQEHLESTVEMATDGVQVQSQSLNFLADEGTISVIVVNELRQPVDGLRLVLSPDRAGLEIEESPGDIRLAAVSRTAVKVRLGVTASGPVTLRASLTTRDGEPIGRSALIHIYAKNPGPWMYAVFGGVAALMVLLGLWRQWRRRHSPVEAAKDTTPSRVGPSAPRSDDEDHPPS